MAILKVALKRKNTHTHAHAQKKLDKTKVESNLFVFKGNEEENKKRIPSKQTCADNASDLLPGV